ncbi:alpha/beta family hydrolase [Niallia nealsonii]|uniref:Alpha/beta hydrolase n=1 Tax=Niallia nealsonii TaxID=115979 RepID=A0A2N0Z5V0_9BACI|nr:alpha/beta hydrolase [Niallia nealsonii]PKG24867.1 alpha/beta hydrolase [Niallia nealsonii]
MKKLQKTAKTKRSEIAYTHIQTGGNQVCFMFSGLGYHYDKPLFYYLIMLMIESKIDVVQVHYSYQRDFLQLDSKRVTEEMLNDVTPVVSEVLQHNSYQNTLFVGKSLGTIPIVNGFMQNDRFAEATMILLTPLLKLDEIANSIAASKHNGLLVIGDKDQHFDEKCLNQLEKTNFHSLIIKNGNHSLDDVNNDSLASIQSMSIIIKNLQKLTIAL